MEGPGSVIEEKVTFCRICEPFCGMIATVENDKLVSVRPDKENPLSRGFACSKGMAYPAAQNDHDRVLYPLRRRGDGTFERVSWDAAIGEIAQRMKRIRTEHGPGSGAFYLGNPAGLNYSSLLWTQVFTRAAGIKHSYSAASQDTNSRFVANHLLYGQMYQLPLPDLDNTEFLVILGANPVVSHMSMCSVPRVSEVLHDIERRGGRVLVIDPRRTETAQEHEWLPIVPDSDAWFLLSLAHVLCTEGLVDEQHLRAVASGFDALKDVAASFSPEATAGQTGIAPDTVREIGRELVARKAAIYGRTGTCLGSVSTLVNFLIDAVNLLAGNLDRRGGWVFGQSPLPMPSIKNAYAERLTRVGSLPTVMGWEPAALMAAEMTTPGPGQIRMLFVNAGNPVLSTPGGPALEKALEGLDLMVSIDLYLTDTNQHADFILPAAAMYEREDLPVLTIGLFLKPFLQATRAVVPPAGESRLEWEILQEILNKAGLWPSPNPLARLAARFARRLTPRVVLDAMIRFGRGGDRYIRRRGLNLNRLLDEHPHGIVFADQLEVGRLAAVVRHKDKKIHLDPEEIRAEIVRLQSRGEDPDYPLRLIGQREPRSENSWMHNVPALRVARAPHGARMHPDDVTELGLTHMGRVRLVSRSGAIELPVIATEDISRGVVAVPHGWGHRGGGWRQANHDGGANVNELASINPEDLEQLAGMSHLSGIRIRAERVELAI
jgi:anaerobic selenocysteine-containing dehydrogenase